MSVPYVKLNTFNYEYIYVSRIKNYISSEMEIVFFFLNNNSTN